MQNNTSTTGDSIRISVQKNGEKTARIQCPGSKTVAELRQMLFSQKIQLPPNAQFLDKQGYPVLNADEKTLQINDLLISTDDENIIQLRVNENLTNIDNLHSRKITVKNAFICLTILYLMYHFSNANNRQSFIHNQLCPLFRNLNISPLIDIFECPVGDPDNPDIPINTTTYLKDQIKDKNNGSEVWINTKQGLKTVRREAHNQQYVAMINEWVQNRGVYKKDYEWYTSMKSNTGTCGGIFDERVIFSTGRIRDTQESIENYTKDNFQDWPQNLRSKINLKNELDGAKHEDGGVFDLEKNGKISDNLYLVAWKRNEENIIQIQTYVTIFERTAGKNCQFTEHYWSSQKERVLNAKRYFLLLKIESNPVYREFLMRETPEQLT